MNMIIHYTPCFLLIYSNKVTVFPKNAEIEGSSGIYSPILIGCFIPFCSKSFLTNKCMREY